MDNDRDHEEIIGWLEEHGAVVWDGMTEDGEAIFKFNLDVLKEVYPPLYEEIMNDLDEDLMKLYKKGLLEIDYDEELNVKFKPTEKGKLMMEQFPFPLED